MSKLEMTEVKQEDLLTSVLLRVTNLDKNATLLECMLDEKNIIITLCFTIINTFQDTKLDPEVLYLLGGQNGLDQTQVIKSIKNYNIEATSKFGLPFGNPNC